MTRVLVFGRGGMLGDALIRAFSARGDVPMASGHRDGNIDSMGFASDAISGSRPEVVVNAAGVTTHRGRRSMMEMIRANALGPHVLAAACAAHGARLVHISTDCVFSGMAPLGQRYRPIDAPDPVDAYGQSKALGEVEAPHVLNLRTSFVGPQHGLWAWLAGHQPHSRVPGWDNALWSGSTVDVVATAVAHIVDTGVVEAGTYHLATDEPMRKADVLEVLNGWLGLRLEIVHEANPLVNRALRHSPELGEPLVPFRAAMAGYFARLQEVV